MIESLKLKRQPALAKRRRVKTPTVLQMEAVECGAAALGIIMEYYGRVAPLEELRVACGVSRNGSKASNLLRAARSYGFKATGFKRPMENLFTGPLPIIVFWNFNHFLVLEGFAGDKVYLNDPAKGPRTITLEEFDSSYTGVALVIEPGPDFVRGGTKSSLVGALRHRLHGSLGALFYVILASLLLTLLGAVVPAFTRLFVDQFLVAGITSRVGPLLLAMGLAAVMMGALAWLQQHHLLRMEMKLALATSSQFFWHVLRLPIEFFHQRRAADISVRVGINDRVAQLLSGVLATNLLNVVLIAFYAMVMVQYDLLLTLLGVVIALLNMAALRYFSRLRVDANQRLLNEQGKFTSTAFNGLQTIETLKATGSESDFFARWAGYQANVVNAEQEAGVTTELLATLPSFLTALNVAVLLTVGGLRIINGQLSFGELVAFQALMASFLMPINQLVNLGSRLQNTQGDMSRIDDVLRYPIDPVAQQDDALDVMDEASQKLSGHLALNNVTFGYSRLEPPLIEDFSLTLKPGARVALVGGSGSGKSTIAKLVSGLYAPWSGEILFDEQPRDQILPGRLKNSLAMVDQEIYLFEGSIRDNITMWDDTIPETSVIQAAKDAVIHEDIASRTGGYEHPVSEGGRNFSGGQRQRLEIARALVNNPTLLVMDEATSALDPVTERLIDDNLRRRGCTCLIVAHRLSTIRDCDEIIVMERGRVVQRGTHDKMIRMSGPYAKLIKADEAMQARGPSLLDLF